MTVALTGVTGRLGGRVAARLADLSLQVLARHPARVPAQLHASVAAASFADVEASRAALEGVSTLLFVSGAEAHDRLDQHLGFVRAATEAGVQHVVYTSFYGAAQDCLFTLGRDHFATEQAIRASGMQWTFLRDSFYADLLPHFAGKDGVIRGPAGDGRVAPVALDDVADVAAAVLRQPAAHEGATYGLTGPESMTLTEVATILGPSYRFENETPEQAYASRAHFGAEPWQLEAWVSTYLAIAAGEMDGVSADVETLAGHRATSLAELLRRSA